MHCATNNSEKNNLCSKHYFSKKELLKNAPNYLMAGQSYSLSDDEYEDNEEKINSKYADLISINPIYIEEK